MRKQLAAAAPSITLTNSSSFDYGVNIPDTANLYSYIVFKCTAGRALKRHDASKGRKHQGRGGFGDHESQTDGGPTACEGTGDPGSVNKLGISHKAPGPFHFVG